MPRTPNQRSRVRFNLPLTRQNTAYSDTASSSHIRNLTEAEVDLVDEEYVANWLASGDTPPPARPYRMHVSQFDVDADDAERPPVSVFNVAPASLPSVLLHQGAKKLGLVPPDYIPPAVLRTTEPQIVLRSKLKKKTTTTTTRRKKSPYSHPDGGPITRMGYNAFYAADEQEYVVPADHDRDHHRASDPTSQEREELRIPVTRDWSAKKLAKHRDDQLLIYRVPAEDQCMFGIMASSQNLAGVTVRRPVDAYDPVQVQRHRQRSWDVGGKGEEVWFLLARDTNTRLINRVHDRIRDARPSLSAKLKRAFWRQFGSGSSPAISYVIQ